MSDATAAVREFHIGDILSAMTGRLVSPRHIDGVYDILGFLAGEPLWTHQLPRACREAEPILRERYPDLAAIVMPDDFTGEAAVLAWLAQQVTIHGETRPVVPLDAADHTSIDPITELRMMRPDAEIIPVVTEDRREPSP
jgi:hypothetical protein